MRRYLLERKRLLVAILAISVIAGIAASIANVGTSPGALQISAASARILLDTSAPTLAQRKTREEDFDSMTKRGELIARVMASPPVLERVAARIGIDADDIGALARVTAPVPLALTEPTSEERASEIQRTKARYRLELQSRPLSPVIDIYAQAPTTAGAKNLASAVTVALREELASVAREQGLDDPEPVRVHQLGPPRGAVVNSKAPWAILVLTFAVAFTLACAALIGLVALHRRRLTGPRQLAHEPVDRDAGLDDWPHTTRLLPWMLAVFLAVLWLVPFNEIQLTASLPIDLKFDRLVLPFVALVWVLALVVGGSVAPRMRFTWIHGAVGLFVIVAFLSVVLDARYLNQTLELDQSLKRLPLLIAYVSLFFIAASAVRHSEVRAFMSYTLGLATVCAVGIIIEYRFKYNPFYDVSQKLLPGVFSVGDAKADNFDGLGRRLVRGPAAVPLEAVAMLAMALPIALVDTMRAREWRPRILNALAICLILAATFATYRKSALLAPVSVVATLAYFRRRELLKLAPLALVLVVVVHVLSPGALGSTTSQLDAAKLGVATVSDRAVDYDAVRPDVWSHLILGRGWGTYNHVDYRILDSEILQRLIEMGAIGLLVYLFMGVSVIALARETIAARDPRSAPLALVGAAGAVSFLVVSTLFDVLSFPHATYIFLFIAGLTAVVVAPPERPAAIPPRQLAGAHPGRLRGPRRRLGRRRAADNAG